jgi:hypothetical protein
MRLARFMVDPFYRLRLFVVGLMYRGSFRAGSSTGVNMLGAQMQNPESHIKINPRMSSFVDLFVASVCRCLVVPVGEPVDERKGYQFGSLK